MVNKRQKKKNAKKSQIKGLKFGNGMGIGEKTISEYKRQVKNTRAKINRIKRTFGVDISHQIEIPKINDFSSRKELNKWIKDVENFRRSNNEEYKFITNEKGYSTSRKRVKELVEQSIKNRQEALEEYERTFNLPYSDTGEKVGMVNPTNLGITIPSVFNFDQVQNEYVMQEFEERINKRKDGFHFDEKKQTMWENFMTILEGSFNGSADELVKAIGKLTPYEFWNIYKSNFNDFDFELYDTEGQKLGADESYIERMLGHVNRYLSGNYDHLDLWHPNFD